MQKRMSIRERVIDPDSRDIYQQARTNLFVRWMTVIAVSAMLIPGAVQGWVSIVRTDDAVQQMQDKLSDHENRMRLQEMTLARVEEKLDLVAAALGVSTRAAK